jgi:hypothetical protein
MGYLDRDVALKALAWLVPLALGVACQRSEQKPHRTEPWLAHPSSSSTLSPSTPRRYRFAPDSSIRFSVPGKRGKVSGRFALARGALELDPREPKNSHADLDVDLTTLTIDTEPPPGVELGGSPNAVALQWLELGPDVAAERRAQFKTARFELASLEGPAFLDLGPQRKPNATRATAVGTLLIHGFRAPVRAEVVLVVGPRLSIRSATPLVVPLGTHDITARGPAGIVDALGAARSADWVGKSARVDFELFADP